MTAARFWILLALITTISQSSVAASAAQVCPAKPPRAYGVTPEALMKQVLKTVDPSIPSGFGGIDAAVKVIVTVDQRGKVVCARGLPDAHPILKALCEKAAWQWEFKPFLVGGRLTQVRGPLIFHIKR